MRKVWKYEKDFIIHFAGRGSAGRRNADHDFRAGFFSALARTVGIPINWAQDIALLAFAWLTFIGADIVAKTGNLIRIDMLEKWLPKTIRKGLALIFDVAMILFLLILIVYGFSFGIPELVQNIPDDEAELCVVHAGCAGGIHAAYFYDDWQNDKRH